MRSVASLLLAGLFAMAALAVAPPASSQCYPGLACPTQPEQQQPPADGGGGGASSGGARSGGAEYHYVGAVSPPDDWLSLRTVPSDKGGSRVMKMSA